MGIACPHGTGGGGSADSAIEDRSGGRDVNGRRGTAGRGRTAGDGGTAGRRMTVSEEIRHNRPDPGSEERRADAEWRGLRTNGCIYDQYRDASGAYAESFWQEGCLYQEDRGRSACDDCGPGRNREDQRRTGRGNEGCAYRAGASYPVGEAMSSRNRMWTMRWR